MLIFTSAKDFSLICLLVQYRFSSSRQVPELRNKILKNYKQKLTNFKQISEKSCTLVNISLLEKGKIKWNEYKLVYIGG